MAMKTQNSRIAETPCQRLERRRRSDQKAKAKGKMTAGTRRMLLDRALSRNRTFITHQGDEMNYLRKILRDGVITGYGRSMAGRFIYIPGFHYLWRHISEMHHTRSVVCGLAVRNGTPLYFLTISERAHPGSVRSMAATLKFSGAMHIFRRRTPISVMLGLVPRRGPLPCTDRLLLWLKNNHSCFDRTRSDQSRHGEVIDSESLGGADVHMSVKRSLTYVQIVKGCIDW